MKNAHNQPRPNFLEQHQLRTMALLYNDKNHKFSDDHTCTNVTRPTLQTLRARLPKSTQRRSAANHQLGHVRIHTYRLNTAPHHPRDSLPKSIPHDPKSTKIHKQTNRTQVLPIHLHTYIHTRLCAYIHI